MHDGLDPETHKEQYLAPCCNIYQTSFSSQPEQQVIYSPTTVRRTKRFRLR